jgi:DNA-binding SARP family transcriptional activator
MLQVRLLGQFDVRADGKRVLIQRRAGQSLLAYLILTAGTPHRREQLAGLFWPDMLDETARRNLRQELWRIRKAISSQAPSPAEYFLAEEIAITFNPQSEYWLDAAQLEQTTAADDPLNDLMNKLAVYQGELLPGFYEDWGLLERERIAALFEAKMQQLTERLIQEQRWGSCQEWAERWLALGQAPEPAYRALMLAFNAMGDRGKVVATFARCQQALDKELGVKPSPETHALYEQLIRGETVTGIDLTSTQVAAVRLRIEDQPPAPGVSPFKGLQYFDEADADLFFGRELLTARLLNRLRDARFLAVVVGASGSGKSSIVRAGLLPALKKGDRWRMGPFGRKAVGIGNLWS